MEQGRPTIMTPENIAKLEEAFSIGASDIEACLIAGIGKSTLYNYQKENPDFLERKEALKDMPKYRARNNIVDAINGGDKETSKWYLERKLKSEFAQRTEQTGAEGNPIQVIVPQAVANSFDINVPTHKETGNSNPEQVSI